VKSTQRHAAIAASFFALALAGTPAVLPAQQQQQPQQRGGPPKQDTPKILIATFRSDDRLLGVQASDAVRRRTQDDYAMRDLNVITKNNINTTLEASGYRPDSALSVNDLMELGKQLGADEVMDATVSKTPDGGVKVEPRILIKRQQSILSQPLPVVTAKNAGDAAKEIVKAMDAALKTIPAFKACENDLRASKNAEAAAAGRLIVKGYPQSTLGRQCMLYAFSAAKESPDSTIKVADELLALDPTSIYALASAADAYKAKGNTDKVIDYSLRIWRADPSNQTIAQSIIQQLATSGAPDKALPIVEELLQGNPGDPQMIRTKWALQIGAKKYKDAYITGEELIKADSSQASAEFFTRMAAVAQADSNAVKATEYLARGVQKFPKSLELQLNYANNLFKAGQLQQALASAQAALTIDPKSQPALTLVLITQSQLNQPDSVMATAQKAMAAGLDKGTVSKVLAGVAKPLVDKAQQTKTREDWLAALQISQKVDSMAASPEAKFFIGVAAFQVGYDALNKMQEYVKEMRTAKPPQQRELMVKACTEAKLTEDMWATSQIAMPAGASVSKETAGQILGAIQQYGGNVTDAKRQLCR
jgi:tetratricopeptide (TPR) repeat protein